jgi:shikimate kinase
MTSSRPAHLVLVGLPGIGKTTVGRGLAERLGREFIDLDELVVARSGASIAQIFASGGEPAFRAAEREATSAISRLADPAVVAAGGGWMTDPDTVALIRPPSRLVYLRGSPQLATARVSRSGPIRPLLEVGEVGALIPRLYMERRATYESADWTVDVENLDPQELTVEILRLVEG